MSKRHTRLLKEKSCVVVVKDVAGKFVYKFVDKFVKEVSIVVVAALNEEIFKGNITSNKDGTLVSRHFCLLEKNGFSKRRKSLETKRQRLII